MKPLNVIHMRHMDRSTLKDRKYMLYETYISIRKPVDFERSKCVGIYKLHKVVWSKSTEALFVMMCRNYMDYAQKHFGSNAIVVFDGYLVDKVHQSSKEAERYRVFDALTNKAYIFNIQFNFFDIQYNFTSIISLK